MSNKTTVSRRGFMTRTAAGAAALAAPSLISFKALASSGELNFTGWAGYPALAETVFPAFTAATGIKVNFTEVPDNDTIFANAKVAATAGGIDMIEPTIDAVGQYHTNGLIGAWDPAKLAMDNYLPGLADGSAGERSQKDGKLVYVPSNWGTEALVYNKADAKLGDPVSLAALFDPANQVVVRPRSALAAMGRLLESQGKLPFPFIEGYSDMAKMVAIWDIALAECVKAKANVVQFWAGRERSQCRFRGKWRHCWSVLGFDRLQPAQRRLWLCRPSRGSVRLASGLFADGKCCEHRTGT